MSASTEFVGVTTPLLKNTIENALNDNDTTVEYAEEDNDEWGGLEGRRRLEKELLWKVDKRMSILILIYILNYVRFSALLTRPVLTL